MAENASRIGSDSKSRSVAATKFGLSSVNFDAKALLAPDVRHVSTQRPYSANVAWEHLWAEPIIPIAGIAALTTHGVTGWGWGSQDGFESKQEGYFGYDTYSGGMDKLGHAWSSMVISDLYYWRLKENGFDPYNAAISAALGAWVTMAAIEIGDGFSKSYAASYEDIVANTAGVAFSFLRNTVPGLKEKLDFRMEWLPGDNSGDVDWGSDYQNKKFLLALKASGFERFEDSPMRFLEFHVGYFARGFSEKEKAAGVPLSRNLYVGLGLNVSELLLSDPAVRETPAARIARQVLGYVQVPYTSLSSNY